MGANNKGERASAETYIIETVAAVTAVVALVAVVVTRSVSGEKIQITLSDATIAAIAAVLVLLIAGRISKLGLSPQGLTVETAAKAIRSAAEAPVERQVYPLPVGSISRAQKDAKEKISTFVKDHVQALEFILLSPGSVPQYNAEDIRQYLEDLTKYPFFHYVIILDDNHDFFGMIDAQKLLRVLWRGSPWTFEKFEKVVNGKNTAFELQKIPGFASTRSAVTQDTDKRDVLARMEKFELEWVPVIADGKFKGIVDRSRLTASLILDITDQLTNGRRV